MSFTFILWRHGVILPANKEAYSILKCMCILLQFPLAQCELTDVQELFGDETTAVDVKITTKTRN